MDEAASSRTSAADSQPVPPTNENNAEAGPSRAINQKKSEEEEFEAFVSRHWDSGSSLPASAVPRSKIRGTDKYIYDEIDIVSLQQIDDPELLRDLPLMGPPPQPARGQFYDGPRPYWGIRWEMCEFLPSHEPHGAIGVSETIEANVERYHRLKAQGVHFNEVLMKNRSFKNPHVYSQLVKHLDIDETRSNLPAVDTTRFNGLWRSTFPLSEEELMEGDPIAIMEQQESEYRQKKQAEREAKLMKGIEFTRGSAR